jgi:peptidoglycan/xylan/chitin deacetylase (PgdA/CDA1 family)
VISKILLLTVLFFMSAVTVWSLAWGRDLPSTGQTQDVVYRVATREKVVALTYDDGPHPRFTPQLLDVLDKHGVKATFFMIGRKMEKYPNIVRDVAKRGHVVANHTYTHPKNIDFDTEAQVKSELERCEDVIERLVGEKAHLFRPPKGLFDGMVLNIANEQGYKTVLWTVCADHHDAPTPRLMAKRVLQHIRPGSIVLAHDGYFGTRWKDVAATALIIEGLRKQGYRFVTVPEMLKLQEKQPAQPVCRSSRRKSG